MAQVQAEFLSPNHKLSMRESSLHRFQASATSLTLRASNITKIDQTDLKRSVAEATIEHIESRLTKDTILGIGTGSTVNFFIEELIKIKHKFDCAVSSSTASTVLLENGGIKVIDLNAAPHLEIYIDGADEANHSKQLIKGGGGALTREKIVAQAADEFVCIIDETKLVDNLGAFPLPVEVIPLARGLVARQLKSFSSAPIWRREFVTDNGNVILDIHDLKITDAEQLERAINDIPGVVSNGLFAIRGAETILVAGSEGVYFIN